MCQVSIYLFNEHSFSSCAGDAMLQNVGNFQPFAIGENPTYSNAVPVKEKRYKHLQGTCPTCQDQGSFTKQTWDSGFQEEKFYPNRKNKDGGCSRGKEAYH